MLPTPPTDTKTSEITFTPPTFDCTAGKEWLRGP